MNPYLTEREQKREKIIQGITLGLLLFNSIALTISFAKPLFVKESPGSTFTPPLREICYQSFKSIIDKKPDERLIKKEIAEFLKKDDYNYFEFLEDTQIKFVHPLDKKCLLITKDIKGLRFFHLDILTDSSSPFLYLIKNIEEKTMKEAI
jgi:hypothetical protein